MRGLNVATPRCRVGTLFDDAHSKLYQRETCKHPAIPTSAAITLVPHALQALSAGMVRPGPRAVGSGMGLQQNQAAEHHDYRSGPAGSATGGKHLTCALCCRLHLTDSRAICLLTCFCCRMTILESVSYMMCIDSGGCFPFHRTRTRRCRRSPWTGGNTRWRSRARGRRWRCIRPCSSRRRAIPPGAPPAAEHSTTSPLSATVPTACSNSF